MPFDPVLTLETAALMLVAFVVGATIGSLLHLAALRLRRAPTVAAADTAAPHASAEPALVAAPIIAPVAMPREPVMPAEVPVPDFSASTVAEPREPVLAPARKPGVATFGRDVGRHDREAPQQASEASPPPEAEAPHIEPDIFGAAESPPEPAIQPIEIAEPVDETVASPAAREPSVESEAPATAAAIDVTAELLALAPTADVAVVDAVLVEASLSAADADEAAAMRAIEGSWTPGRRAPPAEPPAAALPEASPELAAPTLTATAEPIAQSAAERAEAETAPEIVLAEDDEDLAVPADVAPLPEVPDVLPQREEDRILPAEASDEPATEPEPPLTIIATPASHDQPPGIGAPRHGMRDDLTQIVGVLPVVETTLNRLGVYHFDQVADWSDAHAGWVEAHLGIAGRVEREHWREQARELAAIASGKRPSRKKRPS